MGETIHSVRFPPLDMVFAYMQGIFMQEGGYAMIWFFIVGEGFSAASFHVQSTTSLSSVRRAGPQAKHPPNGECMTLNGLHLPGVSASMGAPNPRHFDVQPLPYENCCANIPLGNSGVEEKLNKVLREASCIHITVSKSRAFCRVMFVPPST